MNQCKFCNAIMGEIFYHPLTGNLPVKFPHSRGQICFTCKNGRDRYGLTRMDQIALLEEQGGKCRTCDRDVLLHNGRPPHSAVIDHTGGKPYDEGFRVRGVVCHDCNNLLGTLDKNSLSATTFLHKLLDYYSSN